MSELALVFEVTIRSTPERIWEAITSPDWTRRYFHGTSVRSDWRVGAKVAWELPDGAPGSDGEILEIDPPRRLVTTWRSLWDPAFAAEPPSRVTWEIEELRGSCVLRVTHDRLGSAPKTRDGVRQGWPGIVEGLRDCVEAG